MSGPLRVDRPAEGVVLLTLDLPERRNAMTEELTDAWRAAVAELAADRAVRAVVVTGEGKAFCAGGDLSWLGVGRRRDGRPDPAPRPDAALLPDLAVDPRARGADHRRAQRRGDRRRVSASRSAATCATPPRRRSSAMPFTVARDAPGHGRDLPAAGGGRACRGRGRCCSPAGCSPAPRRSAIGLVNDVFPAERLLDEVLAVAGTDRRRPRPIATRLTKRAMQHGPRSFVEALEWEALAQPVTLASEDLREGLQAQAERRARSSGAAERSSGSLGRTPRRRLPRGPGLRRTPASPTGGAGGRDLRRR